MGKVFAEEKDLRKAIFAGGCFWCMQPVFDHLDGVASTTVGYTGGKKENPSYEEVSNGSTGHFEGIEVVYDPSKVSYETLIEAYWQSVDPTDEAGQFADRGTQYQTAIFYQNEKEKELALQSKATLAASGKFNRPIMTKILPAAPFYPAEEYHQKYYLKAAQHYDQYKKGSGREGFLKRIWGKK